MTQAIMEMDQEKQFLEKIRETVKLVKPPPKLTVSEWADQNRIVSSRVSALPGRWKTEQAPYLREIMDCYNDPYVHTIVIMKPSRWGATEAINNIIGYCIDRDPGSLQYVQSSKDEGRKYNSNILMPMIEETPCLREKVAEARGTFERSTITRKEFPGGSLEIEGGQSEKGARMVAKRVVILDDVDAYKEDVGGEGDPVNLYKKRASTFPVGQRKIIIASSPTVKGFSRIETEMESTDYRMFNIPCPKCGGYQVLFWGAVKFDSTKKAPPVEVECLHCNKLFKNYEKFQMIKNGLWMPTKPFNGKAGFFSNVFVSPFTTWEEVVEDFLESKDKVSTHKVWINTSLAETYNEDDESEEVDQGLLMSRREEYGPRIPEGVKVLTAGVDVQKNRLECEVVGWGSGEESWNIDYRVFLGDPNQAQVWKDLDAFRIQTWKGENEALYTIRAMGVDTGYASKAAYKYVKKRESAGVYAIKGSNVPTAPMVSRPSRSNIGKVNLFTLGTVAIKDQVFSNFKLDESGPGYMHFPMDREEEYFRQLTAEKPYRKMSMGKAVRYYKQVRSRNEALDCRVYASAALHIFLSSYTKGKGRGRRMLNKGVNK